MRELKFRAYIKSLQWLLPVERIYFDCGTVEIDLTDGNGDTAEFDFEEVELMQFIGRKDINQKEVYEGDILKCKDNYTGLEFSGVVAFQDCSFVIKNDCITHYRWMDYTVEVIGNKFEFNGKPKYCHECKFDDDCPLVAKCY